MHTDLYIYYRAATVDADKLATRVHALQAELQATYQISGSLHRRPEDKEGEHTWMEIYLDTDPSFAAVLDAHLADAGILALIRGARHTETFVRV